MIRDAIEECNFSGNILKETDDPEKHKRDILTILNTVSKTRKKLEGKTIAFFRENIQEDRSGKYGDHRRVYRELQRHLMEHYVMKIRCTAFKKIH